MSQQEKVIETFRQHLARLRTYCKILRAEPHVVTWESRNHGEGLNQGFGKNLRKRTDRHARKLNRLAHIRFMRSPYGGSSLAHCPKLKRVPASVFE